MAIVLGQAANAFACRSATRRPGQLGWGTNRLLFVTVAIDVGFGFVVLLVPPIARELGHASPPVVGWLIAVLALPLVLAVDALSKLRTSHVA